MISVNNMDGSKNTGYLKFGPFTSYRHMADLRVKITCAVFQLIICYVTQVFCSEMLWCIQFSYIWYLFIHGIDSIYVSMHSQYLCRSWWSSGTRFNSKSGLVVPIVNGFQLMI